ncbi:craniofacial development protein 1 [Contarinia nasturtii]|uniref:craniofacial development protein 1 n=1 Tax=Contarinia nasturtii TaxID=265458 RepID=UPI0012D3D8AB|nr:craniofacial development protein 1 [Contarinia nasturtii]
MLDEAEYASDTDESDDDYKPGVDGSDVSEVDSDGEPENDVENQPKGKKRSANVEESSVATKRNKRIEEEIKSTEKDELDDDDDDENEDALWASFLGNTGQKSVVKSENKKSTEPSKQVTSTSNGNSTQAIKKIPKPPVRTEQKKVVTEIFEFAGEKVEIKKKVKVTDEKPVADTTADSKKVAAKPGPSLPFGRSRGSGGGGAGGSSGLSSLLGQIGKKNKLSVLEKSKLDWNGFKQTEGIDEELQTHNKGRDGYLERQDFLQRTDLRQFEIEKNLRAVTRKKL